jgi:hypothetical protein
MRASLLRGGRRSAPGNLVLQDLLSYTSLHKLVTRLLEVRTVTVSGDSSRKWRFLWSVLENLDWNLQGSLWCWRMLGSVSEHRPLHKATIPHSRITQSAKIEESATRHVNRQVEVSPLPWWDKTYLLQMVFSYHEMKLITTLCLSHRLCYLCPAGKVTQWATCFAEIFIKQLFCSKWLCLLCCMLPACRLEPMISKTKSIYWCILPSMFGTASRPHRKGTAYNARG